MRRQVLLTIIVGLILPAIIIGGCRVRDAGEDEEPTPPGQVSSRLVDREGDVLTGDTDQDGTPVAQQNTETPTDAPTSTATATITQTPTDLVSPTPSSTATNTALPSAPSATPTSGEAVPMGEPSATSTATTSAVGVAQAGSPTSTGTATNTPTNTPTNTATSTPSDTPTNTRTPTSTSTSTNTPTPTLAISPTFTSFPTLTPTAIGIAQQASPPPPQQATATALVLRATAEFWATQGTPFAAQTLAGGQQGTGPEPGTTPGAVTGATSTPYPDCAYLIQPGDTLSSIARLYRMDTSTLINANPALITNEDYIRAGDILTIPGCGRNPTPTPIGGGAAGTPTPFFGTPPGFGSGGATGTDGSATYDNTTGPIQYVVQAGDNVYQLSVRFGVTMRSIQTANPRLRDDINYLVVGETLTIPARTIFDTPTPTLSSAG